MNPVEKSVHQIEIIWKDDGSRDVRPFSTEENARLMVGRMKKLEAVHEARYLGIKEDVNQ